MWGTVKPQSRLVRRQNGVVYSLMPLKGVEIVQIYSSTNKKTLPSLAKFLRFTLIVLSGPVPVRRVLQTQTAALFLYVRKFLPGAR